MHSILFFRNDDVRGSLDKSLIEITEAFVQNEIPVSHAVEPANVTPEVIDWLKEQKKKYPNLIEIIQHGYNHKLNVEVNIGGKIRKGEFGGNRTYKEQFDDISAGKKLMEKYFGDMWFPAFTFPYGSRNEDAIKAVNDAGFKVVNGGYNPSLKYRILYAAGHLLRKKILFNRRISYNLSEIPGTNLVEIDMGFGFIKKYLDEDVNSDLHSFEFMKRKLENYKGVKVTGVLLHHRYHDSGEKINLVKDFLSLCKEKKYTFLRQEDIYKKVLHQ